MSHPQVTAYINAAPSAQRQMMDTLRKLIHSTVPGVTEEYKWSRPIFRTTKDIAYLKSGKAYLTLGFYEHQKLDDPEGRLEGTGKNMRHIKLRSEQDIDAALLKKWLRAVVAGQEESQG